MKVGKYVSLGMSLSGKHGKVSWFHAECVPLMDVVAGGMPWVTEETPPEGAICRWCGALVIEEPRVWTEVGVRA